MPGPSRAVAEFVSESQEIIDALSRDLLALDRSRGQEPDPELLNRIFRGAHSLKGLGGMFGATRLSSLAHTVEDLLDGLRLGRVPLSDATLDLLLESIEVFQKMITEIGEGAPSERSDALATSLADRLHLLKERGAAAAPGDPLDQIALDPKVRQVLTEYEEHRLRENVKKGRRLFFVRALFDLADFDKGLAEVGARLKPLGELISTLPSAVPSVSGLAFDLLFSTREEAARLTQVVSDVRGEISVSELTKAERPPPEALPPSPVPPAPPAARPGPAAIGRPEVAGEPETSLRSAAQTVRVDIRRLDRLINLVGELNLGRAGVQRLAEALRAEADDLRVRAVVAELTREARAMDRRLTELQKGLLEVRLVPLGQVFDKLARLVRKIARESNKEIDFRIAGSDVELDKLIVEELSDPLMHLIRNALDHGIEAPEVRERAGKPRRGVVSLSAYQKGNHVVIEVSDDGGGIDPERVREVAIRRGLISEAAARELGRGEVLNFIFAPGFSTASEVSELSGRGVGMDVVKTNIAQLSGIIDLATEVGRGTQFSITLPVTLAIIRALLVEVASRVYAIPLNSVLEIVSVRPRDVRAIERREVIDLRGQTLRLLRLAELFRLEGARAEGPLYVVVAGLAQERLGMAVDGLIGQQDIVIKPLGKALPPVRGVAGATDLGQRRTVLVLDVGGIIAEVLHPAVPVEQAG